MDPELQNYIMNFVSSMEGSTANPYSVSFAGTGTSGLSFGLMQNDVANNSAAKAAFQNILTSTASTTGLTSDQISWIVSEASTKGITGTQFNADSIQAGYGNLIPQINQALQTGSALVNAQDQAQAQNIFNMVESAFAAAATNPNGPGELNPASPNLEFVGELAEWGNRTGGLAATDAWLSTAPSVSQASYENNYLSQQKQFTTGGESFSTWQQRLNTANTYANAQAATPLSSSAVTNALQNGQFLTGTLNGISVSVGTNSSGATSLAADDGTETIVVTATKMSTWEKIVYDIENGLAAAGDWIEDTATSVGNAVGGFLTDIGNALVPSASAAEVGQSGSATVTLTSDNSSGGVNDSATVNAVSASGSSSPDITAIATFGGASGDSTTLTDDPIELLSSAPGALSTLMRLSAKNSPISCVQYHRFSGFFYLDNCGVQAGVEWSDEHPCFEYWIIDPKSLKEERHCIVYNPDFKLADAMHLELVPTRMGMYIAVGDPDSTRDKQGLYKISDSGSKLLVRGVVLNAVTSPNGCRVAFAYARYTKNLRIGDEGGYSNRAIDVCKEAK